MSVAAVAEGRRPREFGAQARHWLLARMPLPGGQRVEPVLDCRAVRRGHYLRAFVWIVAVYALVLLITAGAGKWALFSPLYLGALLVHALYAPISVSVAFVALYAPLLIRMGRFVHGVGGGFREGLARAAMREEQAPRSS